MTDNDYLLILLDGLKEHSNYFAQHLKRNAEVAKLNGIDVSEYYNRLKAANNRILEALVAQLHQHKGMSQFNDGEEHQPFTMEQMRVNLFQFVPGGNYTGQLSFETYEKINRVIEWESAMAEFLIRADASLNEQKEKKERRRKNIEIIYWAVTILVALTAIVVPVVIHNADKEKAQSIEKKLYLYKAETAVRMDSLYKKAISIDHNKR